MGGMESREKGMLGEKLSELREGVRGVSEERRGLDEQWARTQWDPRDVDDYSAKRKGMDARYSTLDTRLSRLQQRLEDLPKGSDAGWEAQVQSVEQSILRQRKALKMRSKDRWMQWRWEVTMVVRNHFRLFFGVTESDRCGFWVDREMAAIIGGFGHWLEYPPGDLVLRAHHSDVRSVAISEDDCVVCSGDQSGWIVCWDLLKGEKTAQWKGHDGWVRCLILRSGRLLSTGEDCAVKVWDYRSEELVRSMEGHTRGVFKMHLSEDGSLLVSAASDGTLRLWSMADFSCVRTITDSSHVRFTAVMIRSGMVVSGDSSSRMKVWSERSGKVERCEDVSSSVCDLSLNCDASLLACMTQIRTVVFEWPGLEQSRTINERGFFGQFHPSQPDILALVGNLDFSVRLWNVRSGDCLREWKGHSDRVTGLAFSSDGQRLVSTSWDLSVRVWDLSSVLD